MRDVLREDPDSLAIAFFSGDGDVSEAAGQYSRAELTAYFNENIRKIEELVAAMSPAQLAYRPPGAPAGVDSSGDEEHFDASQIVTHLASGIAFHWWGMTRALGHPRPDFPKPPEGTKTTGSKANIMGGGGWSGATSDELARVLRETSDRFLLYVAGLPDDLDTGATSSLGVFRDLSAKGWLLLEAVHTAMHLKQLRDMQAMPDYPAA